MSKVFLFLIVLQIVVVTIESHNDYCSLCQNHIACNDDGGFGKDCPREVKIVKFDKKLQRISLDTHNELRNKIAKGELKGFDKAGHMATLQWNDELAELILVNLKRCIFDHDQCRKTKQFKYPGQNLAQTMNNVEYGDPEKETARLTKAWFDEYKDANMEHIDNFHNRPDGKMIGHFTQVVRDEAYAMGCAIVQYKDKDQFVTLYGCDYTLTNMYNLTIYKKSSKPASKCISGSNPKLNGLCSTKEIYNNPMFYN